jgi:hypothetical protein
MPKKNRPKVIEMSNTFHFAYGDVADILCVDHSTMLSVDTIYFHCNLCTN